MPWTAHLPLFFWDDLEGEKDVRLKVKAQVEVEGLENGGVQVFRASFT